MIQIAIWGIAFMLIVKGVDMLAQQRIAKSAGHDGSPLLSTIGFFLALVFALALFTISSSQVSSIPTPPTFPGNL